MVRRRLWRDSKKPEPLAATIFAIVSRLISVAGYQSPTSADQYFATKKILAATIRSIVGGAART
jgi:hypothetical protein